MQAVQKRSHLSLVHSADAAEQSDAADRRAHERLTVSDLAWLNQVRLKYGPPVSLVDLSAGGVQIETSSHRLQPGSTVVIEIAGQHGEVSIPSRVVRCNVTNIVPQTTYRGALEFKRLFELPAARPVSHSPEPEVNPAHEHARLMTALRRFAVSNGFESADSVAGVGSASLSAALALIESPSGRRAGVPFARELGRLFKIITRAIESNEGLDQLTGELTERLRRAVPARTVRLIDADSPQNAMTQEAISFDIPAAQGRPGRLLIEFPRGCRIEEWHFQLLKASAHLAALCRDIESLLEARAATQPSVPATSAAPMPAPPGWHRMVVRYRDGRMLKGFGRDFLPERGQVHISSSPDAPPQSRITVLLAQLKAIFFVHDFDGVKPGADVPIATPTSGRRIVVTFLDGEVLTGVTITYTADGPGFFVTPTTDVKTNNHRIFVVGSAVRQVQFP